MTNDNRILQNVSPSSPDAEKGDSQPSGGATGHTDGLAGYHADLANAAATVAALKPRVVRLVRSKRPNNMQRAYDPKVIEWRAYCDHRFRNTPPEYRYTVDKTRVYEFMLYQIFRKKHPQVWQ